MADKNSRSILVPSSNSSTVRIRILKEMFQINSHRRVFLNFLVLVVLINCIQQSSSLSIHSSSICSSNRSTMSMSMMQQVQSRSQKKLITISEKVWRTAASNHRKRIQSILRPGLTSRDDQINTGSRRQGSRRLDSSRPEEPYL